MTPSQTRTNHLGYDVGPSRKIADGALARATTTECLKANKSNALTRLALMLFRLLCFSIGVVKAALKAAAAIITARPTDRGGAPPALFQLQLKVDGATVMLDAGSAWTAADVKAALHAKTGRASSDYYLVAAGGKPLDDGAATTLAAPAGPATAGAAGRPRGGMAAAHLRGLQGQHRRRGRWWGGRQQERRGGRRRRRRRRRRRWRRRRRAAALPRSSSRRDRRRRRSSRRGRR